MTESQNIRNIIAGIEKNLKTETNEVKIRELNALKDWYGGELTKALAAEKALADQLAAASAKK